MMANYVDPLINYQLYSSQGPRLGVLYTALPGISVRRATSPDYKRDR